MSITAARTCSGATALHLQKVSAAPAASNAVSTSRALSASPRGLRKRACAARARCCWRSRACLAAFSAAEAASWPLRLSMCTNGDSTDVTAARARAYGVAGERLPPAASSMAACVTGDGVSPGG